MDSRISILKGIHPGKLIDRDLIKKKLTQRSLAEKTAIPYQTINAIITGKRNLTIEQAMKIELTMGYEEGFLALLQTYYEIKQCKEKKLSKQYSGFPNIRRSLFWDADFDKINWGKYKNAVIRRVLERGSNEELEEIRRFYNLSENELTIFENHKQD